MGTDDDRIKEQIEEALELNPTTPRHIHIAFYPETGQVTVEKVCASSMNLLELKGILREALHMLETQDLSDTKVEKLEENENEQGE